MSNLIRISSFNYTNIKPFLYGINKFNFRDNIELKIENEAPHLCTKYLLDDTADVAIIPVATLPIFKNYEIISDYCIGADGIVDSVFIFSKKKITEVNSLAFDSQSRTSNNLAKILFKFFWKKDFTESNDIESSDAQVLIGDRTFGIKDNYPYVYDLAEEWKKMTGLPFVFAVWVSNKKLSDNFKADFNKALELGLSLREEMLIDMEPIKNFDIKDYLYNKISFNYDNSKKEALKLYLEHLNKI